MGFDDIFADESAVSSAVGTPMMVAITVALASMVGTSVIAVGNDSSNFQEPILSTAQVQFSDGEGVSVLWNGNQNADRLGITFVVNDTANRTVVLEQVGDSAVLDGNGLTVSGSGLNHDEEMTVEDGDSVRVTVVAIRGDQRTVIAQATEEV